MAHLCTASAGHPGCPGFPGVVPEQAMPCAKARDGFGSGQPTLCYVQYSRIGLSTSSACCSAAPGAIFGM
jgi:hypothetical protein